MLLKESFKIQKHDRIYNLEGGEGVNDERSVSAKEEEDLGEVYFGI